jgi:hypothetical protein
MNDLQQSLKVVSAPTKIIAPYLFLTTLETGSLLNKFENMIS